MEIATKCHEIQRKFSIFKKCACNIVTSLLRSPTSLGKSDLNNEVTLLPKQTTYNSCQYRKLFGTEQERLKLRGDLLVG